MFRANLEYYFEEGNLTQFKRIAVLLNKYKGNRNYINYKFAKLYMLRKSYKAAYYYFYKVTLNQNDLWNDSLYNLAMINLHVFRKRNEAIKNLTKLVNTAEETEYSYKSKLELAIIYYENGKKEESKKILFEILKSPKRKLYAAKAKNLIIKYDFN